MAAPAAPSSDEQHQRADAGASSLLSGIVREPLTGQRVRCPVAADTEVALGSPSRTVDGLRRAAEADAAAWGPPTAINMPALTVSVGAIADALEAVAGAQARSLIDWDRDPAIERIVAGWPSRVAAPRAATPGLQPDADVADLVRSYAAENPQALRFALRR
jgi:hypothetical protein